MSIEVIGAGFGRTGTLTLKAALEQLGFAPCYHYVEVVERRPGRNDGHLRAWVDFAKGMAPLMFPNAQAMANIAGTSNTKSKVLDVAAGHGIFGILMATKNPNAHIVALDWPKVLEVAEENARRFNVADRWSKLAGDALTVDYGPDYDLILLTNFLHHFSPPDCEKIMVLMPTT